MNFYINIRFRFELYIFIFLILILYIEILILCLHVIIVGEVQIIDSLCSELFTNHITKQTKRFSKKKKKISMLFIYYLFLIHEILSVFSILLIPYEFTYISKGNSRS